jgi:hypothetical protein
VQNQIKKSLPPRSNSLQVSAIALHGYTMLTLLVWCPSSEPLFFFFYTHSYLRNCSVVFEMQSTRLGLTIGSNGTTNPSTSLPRSSGWCVVHCQSFINSLSSRSPRLENAMSISSDSHMDGQLKNSSSLASRTSVLMHVNGDIYKNLVM